MNKRIKELADQATKFIEPNDPQDHYEIFDKEKFAELIVRECIDTLLQDHYEILDKEKFAELIVRECIDTLLWHGCDDAVPYIEWMAKNKLGQRFGVE